MINKSGALPFLLSSILFIFFYPGLLILLILNELVRALLSIILSIKYNNKFSLVPHGDDGFWAYKKEGSTRNVIILGIVENKNFATEDIIKMYNQKLKTFIDPKSGKNPYDKLEKVIVTKFGYFCWKDCSEAFDIQDHVRSLDKDILYSKEDVWELTSDFSKDMDDTKPQWEVVIIPRFDDGK